MRDREKETKNTGDKRGVNRERDRERERGEGLDTERKEEETREGRERERESNEESVLRHTDARSCNVDDKYV